MNSDLIPTNGLWYKIKKFFKNTFSKAKLHNVDEVQTSKENQTYNNVIANDSLKEKFERDTNKHLLANKLLYGELNQATANLKSKEYIRSVENKLLSKNKTSKLTKIKQYLHQHLPLNSEKEKVA